MICINTDKFVSVCGYLNSKLGLESSEYFVFNLSIIKEVPSIIVTSKSLNEMYSDSRLVFSIGVSESIPGTP